LKPRPKTIVDASAVRHRSAPVILKDKILIGCSQRAKAS
jgi:hypothetical protein